MADFKTLRELADECMRATDFQTANGHYHAAWDDYASQRRNASDAGNVQQFDEAFTARDAFWLLMSGANAQFCGGDFEGCLDSAVTAFELFKELGFVAGNPLFHLRVGQSSFELDPPGDRDEQGMTIDNLARALICGGPEIFAGEDPRYLELVLPILRPPQGFSTWHEATGEGCSMHILDGSTGFLAELFEEKYQSPPPYAEP